MLEKINKLDNKITEICKKVDKIRIILAKEGINNDNEWIYKIDNRKS